MASVPAFPPGFEIVQLSGPLIIAYLADWALFATLTVQLFLYYQAFPKDRLLTKSLVYAVYSIQLVQVILATISAFKMFGSHYGDISALTAVGFGWYTACAMALDSLIVQSFYAFRIYMLSKSKIIPALIAIASMAVSVSGFITARSTLEGNITTVTGRSISTTIAVYLSGSALIDIIIAVCMTYHLTKRGTGFRRTHALISKLTRLTIETGCLTALTALITLILFFAFPGKIYYMMPADIMPMMYANTMFAVLNSRFTILGGRSMDMTSTDLIPIPAHMRITGTMSSATTHPPGPVVSIERQIFSDGARSINAPVELKTVHKSSDGDVYV